MIKEVDIEDLFPLRLETLGKSDFVVEVRCLEVSEADQIGKNIGIYEGGELVSSLRLLEVRNDTELEAQLDYPLVENLKLIYPGIVFGKAGTLSKARGKGHMKDLFHEALKLSEAYGFVAFTMKPTNPLAEYPLSFGFERFLNRDGWHRFGYQSLGETFVYLKRNLKDGLSPSDHRYT